MGQLPALAPLRSMQDVKVHDEKEEAGVGKEVEYTVSGLALHPPLRTLLLAAACCCSPGGCRRM